MEKTYAVIQDVEYYQGDCQHPKGWSIDIATYADEAGEFACIGTKEECQEWIDEIDRGNIYLNHGEAAKVYYVVEIADDDVDYQTWLDGQDWDRCPFEDPQDDEQIAANCDWAETKNYNNDGLLYIGHPDKYNGIIIDLSTKN